MNKKTILLFLTLLCVFILSCSDKNTKKMLMPKIGLVIYRFDDNYMTRVRHSIETIAKDKATLVIADSQNQQAMQNDQVDSLLAQGVSALIVNPVDRRAGNLLISKAQKEDVPIIFINRQPDICELNSWDKAYYVGTNSYETGRICAQIILDYRKNNPQADFDSDGVLRYVVLMGDPYHQDTIQRTLAYKEVFASSNIKTQEIAQDYAYWDRKRAQEKMRGFISYAQSHNLPIEAVLANNDDMALGAIDALKEAGCFDKKDHFIPVVGIDACPLALESIAQQELLGTVLNDAQKQGLAAFEIAYALAKGETNINLSVGTLTGSDGFGEGNYVWIPSRKITQKNYQEFR